MGPKSVIYSPTVRQQSCPNFSHGRFLLQRHFLNKLSNLILHLTNMLVIDLSNRQTKVTGISQLDPYSHHFLIITGSLLFIAIVSSNIPEYLWVAAIVNSQRSVWAGLQKHHKWAPLTKKQPGVKTVLVKMYNENQTERSSKMSSTSFSVITGTTKIIFVGLLISLTFICFDNLSGSLVIFRVMWIVIVDGDISLVHWFRLAVMVLAKRLSLSALTGWF